MRNVTRNRVVSCQEQLALMVLPFCRIYKYGVERTRKEREKEKRVQRKAATVRKCVFQRERKEQRDEQPVASRRTLPNDVQTYST